MQGEEIFQTIPEWAQFSQGNWRNGQQNHVTLTWKSPWKACSITHLPFWAPNSKMMKGFSETLPTKIKPTKCPASSKKKWGKESEKRGKERKRKVKVESVVLLLNPCRNFVFCACPNFARTYFAPGWKGRGVYNLETGLWGDLALKQHDSDQKTPQLASQRVFRPNL